MFQNMESPQKERSRQDRLTRPPTNPKKSNSPHKYDLTSSQKSKESTDG